MLEIYTGRRLVLWWGLALSCVCVWAASGLAYTDLSYQGIHFSYSGTEEDGGGGYNDYFSGTDSRTMIHGWGRVWSPSTHYWWIDGGESLGDMPDTSLPPGVTVWEGGESPTNFVVSANTNDGSWHYVISTGVGSATNLNRLVVVVENSILSGDTSVFKVGDDSVFKSYSGSSAFLDSGSRSVFYDSQSRSYLQMMWDEFFDPATIDPDHGLMTFDHRLQFNNGSSLPGSLDVADNRMNFDPNTGRLRVDIDPFQFWGQNGVPDFCGGWHVGESSSDPMYVTFGGPLPIDWSGYPGLRDWEDYPGVLASTFSEFWENLVVLNDDWHTFWDNFVYNMFENTFYESGEHSVLKDDGGQSWLRRLENLEDKEDHSSQVSSEITEEEIDIIKPERDDFEQKTVTFKDSVEAFSLERERDDAWAPIISRLEELFSLEGIFPSGLGRADTIQLTSYLDEPWILDIGPDSMVGLFRSVVDVGLACFMMWNIATVITWLGVK